MYYQMPLKNLFHSGIVLLGIISLFSCDNSEKKQVPEKKKKEEPKTTDSKPDPEKEAFDILRFLVNEEAKEDRKATIDYKHYSVSFANGGDHYSVSFSKIAAEDFNKDGLTDYIVWRNSEGMLGGSGNTNSEILYLLMGQNNQILQKHEILTYAPFSYNILDELVYKNGKLKVKATQNFRTYTPVNEEELVLSIDLAFVYKNGNVYEESYLEKCELAKWKNKQLFKGNSEVTRTIDMHNYTETIHEKFNTKEFAFSADLSGCDNLNLVVEGSFSYRGKDEKFLSEKRAHFLDYLKSNTSLQKEFTLIRNYLLTNQLSDEFIELEGFSFNLFTSQEKGKTHFRLVLDQTKNPNQTENWEITTRH